MVAQTVSEVRFDMGRWKTEAHFASWLGLSPDNQISGDKVLRKGTRRVVNRTATALRQAANTCCGAKPFSELNTAGCAANSGPPKRLPPWPTDSRLVFRMLKHGQAYVDKGAEYYKHRYRNQQIHRTSQEGSQAWLPDHGAPSLIPSTRTVSGERSGAFSKANAELRS
jgi:hypothetical protein